MKKRYLLLAAVLTIFGFFIWYIKNYSFIPSAKTCGAAVNPNAQLEDTFERAIECMLAGHKDVYWGNINGILQERAPQQFADREIQAIYLPFGSFILYTKKGDQTAHLLEQLIQEEDKHGFAFEQKNHYLFGRLLGYSEEDIKYFYERTKLASYDQDKNKAIRWIAQNSK
ncbi:hypothetical protein BH09DEP1_BH09DEP1_3910 [soil metagenome]